MSNASLRRCVRYDVSYRKMDESASDVVGYGMVTRCHQHCGGATDSVHRQSSRFWLCVEDGDFYSPEACVFLKHVTSQASKLNWIHPWIGNRDSE